MSRLSLVILLSACSVADQATPLAGDQLPPTGDLGLESITFIAGQTGTLRVTGANQGDRVRIAMSFAGEGAGNCPPILGGECLSVLSPVNVLRTIRADANGVAELTVNVPASPRSTDVWFQAIVVGTPSALSFPLYVDMSGQGDADSDGLADLDELNLGTDPNQADSDGGGALDGAEVDAGTDPLSNADDAYVALSDFTVGMDVELEFSGVAAGLACLFANVCDCTASYEASGTRIGIDGNTVLFDGSWTQTSTSCDSAVGLADQVWAANGPAYHTLTFADDGQTLSTWVAHADINAGVPDVLNPQQWVVEAIDGDVASAPFEIEAVDVSSESGVTATATTLLTFGF